VLRIEVATELSDELVDAFARLVPQLSERSAVPGPADLARLLDSSATTVLLARDDDVVIGTLTLALIPLPTGLRAWIEDVVVDEGARGRGAGEALVREAIRLASEAGARTVDLTSRPTRAEANRLYERVGFRPRETNVYRFDIADSSGSL
jgi:ribosomal protein S18 acetylase RimI-like enzyme